MSVATSCLLSRSIRCILHFFNRSCISALDWCCRFRGTATAARASEVSRCKQSVLRFCRSRSKCSGTRNFRNCIGVVSKSHLGKRVHTTLRQVVALWAFCSCKRKSHPIRCICQLLFVGPFYSRFLTHKRVFTLSRRTDYFKPIG